jgi:hypothetical protein
MKLPDFRLLILSAVPSGTEPRSLDIQMQGSLQEDAGLVSRLPRVHQDV